LRIPFTGAVPGWGQKSPPHSAEKEIDEKPLVVQRMPVPRSAANPERNEVLHVAAHPGAPPFLARIFWNYLRVSAK
jgi:hypothetical protein